MQVRRQSHQDAIKGGNPVVRRAKFPGNPVMGQAARCLYTGKHCAFLVSSRLTAGTHKKDEEAAEKIAERTIFEVDMEVVEHSDESVRVKTWVRSQHHTRPLLVTIERV